ARILVSLKGVVLTVSASTTLEGELRVEFGTPPNALAEYGGQLVIEALGTAGMDVDDLAGWKQSIDGNTLTLRGQFTEAGLRSMLLPLTPPSLAPAHSAADAATKADPKALASQKYFRTLKTMLDELQQPKNNKAHNRISYL